jgi:hypothetical protein
MKMKKIFSVIALALSCMTSAYGQVLSVDDVQMEVGTQKQMAVALNNSGKQLSALQFDLVVPQGVTVDVEGATLNPSRVADHEIHVKQMGDNLYRFLVFSMTNADFVGSTGDLVYVPVTSGEDMLAGAVAFSIEEQLVCSSDGSNKDLANVTFDVQMTGSQSLTFDASGLLTCVSKFDLDFSNFDNVEAYIATGYDNASNELYLTRVYDVPAGTPVLIKGPAEETITISGAASAAYYPENFLKGSAIENSAVSAAIDGYENWVLEDGKFGKVAEDMTLGAGKAYLQLTKSFASSEAITSVPFILSEGTLAYVGKNDLDFTDVEGLKAYAVTGFAKGGNVMLTPVKKASADTPLYLVGEKDVTYMVPSTATYMAYANMLKGSAYNPANLKELDSSLVPFILTKSKFVAMSDRVLELMNYTLNDGFVYMPVLKSYAYDAVTNKAYDTFMTEAEVISMKLDSNRTAINGVKASRKDEGVWYNLQGQRVENPRKGLYILDGKKKVLK